MADNGRHIQQPVIEAVTEFDAADLEDLCEAAEEAILDGNGFGWLSPPPRSVQENFGGRRENIAPGPQAV